MTRRFRVFPVVRALAWLAVLLPLAATAAPAAGPGPRFSQRLIVELEEQPLAADAGARAAVGPGGVRFTPASPAVALRAAAIEQGQRAFLAALQGAMPAARVAAYRDEQGREHPLSYRITFNGMTIDPGAADGGKAIALIEGMPGVKAVYRDRAHEPSLFASLPLIDAPALWDDGAIGGVAGAGLGVKVASVDGGVHHDAPMFSGAGFSYPPGFPPSGLGLTANNNGKIIVSRAYFRAGDPPAPGDENPWPGESGTSHGVHTAGIAAGNPVTADYAGLQLGISGVAPAAWVMSYRVFYASASGDTSFYDAEGIAALEDVVADGADVVNNSWGAGPTGIGGEGDPLDLALVNAARAGVFVAMSAGNSGPAGATADHPSADYITVASTSTAAKLEIGRFSVTAPVPVPAALQLIPWAASTFGGSLPEPGTVTPYEYVPGERLVPANIDGCAPWPAGSFTGKAALIRRGTCEFGLKVLYAEQAGAVLVVVYNHVAGGEALVNMGPGVDGGEVTIPSIFVGNSRGSGMIAQYDTAQGLGVAAICAYDGTAYDAGGTPDVVASSSSRGPGVGNVLKPDLAAPGVSILSQGYALAATGEARHLGFGIASGTSMASPHVAGAAALLRQIHPDWPNAWIKSALMSTATYLGITTDGATPAQPLDVGAGRLSLTHAADPGVVLEPPSVGFGLLAGSDPGPVTYEVRVTNVGAAPETYTLSTLDTRDGFDALKPLDGFTVSPTTLSLDPGASATVTVSCFPAAAGAGDSQGYVVLEGGTHQAHFPVWARMKPDPVADVLIIDNDASFTLALADYGAYYTGAVGALGYGSTLWDADARYGSAATIPDPATLASYLAVVYFTGDNYYRDGSFSVHTPLTSTDMARLTEYANGGGRIIAMGQDMHMVLNQSFFAANVLGDLNLRDSVSGNAAPPLPILPAADAPPALHGIVLDLGSGADGAGNQLYVDEMSPRPNFVPGTPSHLYPYRPLFAYSGPGALDANVVSVLHRDQPSLERPEVSYPGCSVFAGFGLEGVNDTTGTTTRSALLGALLDTCLDAPTAEVTATAAAGDPNGFSFAAQLTSNVGGTTATAYRWDFGDGSGVFGPYPGATAYHVYDSPGTYAVRVEITDSWGNRAVGTTGAATPGGSLQVTIAPADAAAAGAWRVDGGSWQPSGAVVGNLAVGEHAIDFRPAEGFVTPASQWATVADGATTAVEGAYVKLGGIRVRIIPLDVRKAARWRVDDGAWTKSGRTVAGLEPGPHLVTFRPVRGWRKPAANSVTVPSGAIVRRKAVYRR